MSRIGSSYHQIRSVVRGGGHSKAAKIDAIKAEIEKIKYQEFAGTITPAEADAKIAILEAKLAKIESGMDFETAQIDATEGIVQQDDITQVDATDSSNNDGGEDCFDDDDDKEDLNSDYFEQQAISNKIYHNI